MGSATTPTQVVTSTRKSNHEIRQITFPANWGVLSLFCVVSYRLQTARNRGTVVTYVAKASSLAKTLIKPLTIIPTKPDLKAIHRVCTKESGGMQVPSAPPLRVLKDVCCTWGLKGKCLFAIMIWRKNMNITLLGDMDHLLCENLLSLAPAAIFLCQAETISLIANTAEDCRPALVRFCQSFEAESYLPTVKRHLMVKAINLWLIFFFFF